MAAQADFFKVFIGGKAASVGGTSAASPTFASIISLLNDARISKGLPALGFLNPMIYLLSEGFPNAFYFHLFAFFLRDFLQ